MVTPRPGCRLAARAALVAATAVVIVLAAPSWPAAPGVGAAASEPTGRGGCAARFPDQAWDFEHHVSGVSVSTAGLNRATSERLAGDVDAAAAMMSADGLAPGSAAVCLFADDIPLDAADLAPPGQQLHAVAWLPDQVVAVSASSLRLVRRAAVLGLTHAILWHRDAEGGYVEPLSSAIAQWYVSRVEGTLGLRHAEMRRANFFEPLIGTEWTAGIQQPVLVWNPQFQDSAIGDIVDYAVRHHGSSVLLDPDPVLWERIEREWSAALLAELLGEDFRTTGWVLGLVVFVGVILLAVVLGLRARRVKRSRLRRE